jgi:hypothetical protein
MDRDAAFLELARVFARAAVDALLAEGGDAAEDAHKEKGSAVCATDPLFNSTPELQPPAKGTAHAKYKRSHRSKTRRA